MTTFPASPLPIKVELLLNGTWTDISIYVYERDPVVISDVGRADESSTIQPAQVTMTLDNRTGRFTPKNTAGAYFPYIGRNVQLRLSVNATSSASVTYSGYRFWGEVSELPVAWDPSGNDVYASITASGSWRRISQNTQQLGSPYYRYVTSLTGSSVPQAYWAMEDGSGSTSFAAATAGTSAATWTGGPPALGADSSFPGSDSIPQLSNAIITATVPAGGTHTNNCVRFLLDVPAAGDSNQGVNNWCIAEIDTGSTQIGQLEVYISSFAASNGKLIFQAVHSGSIVIGPVTTSTDVRGVPLLVSVELTPSGSSVAWAIRLIRPGDGSILESKTGTKTSSSIGAVTTVVLDRSAHLTDTAVGHLSVDYQVPSLVTAAGALNGHSGEFALDRFTRLCAEAGIGAETIGTAATSAAMGPQADDTLPNLLQSIEDTDCGLLYESTDQLGLGYRTMASMQNQTSAVNIVYSSAELADALNPVYDDSLTHNAVTATDQAGNTATATLVTGAMSVLAPPNGIGPGYAYSRTICASASSQVQTVAQHLLSVGAVDEDRYPVVTIDLARSEVASLFSSFPALRVGDFFQITSPPSFLTASTIKQLAWGYTETLSNFTWTIAFNAIPETPWETTFNPGTVTTTTGVGSPVTQSQAAAAAALASIIGTALQSRPILPSQLPQLTASLIGNLGVLNPNPYFAGGDGSGWAAVNGTFSVTNAPPAGTPYTYAGVLASTGAGDIEESGTGDPFPVTPLQQYLVSAWIYTPQTSVAVGFGWQDASNTFLSSSTQTFTVTANTWTQVTTVQSAPSGARFGYPQLAPPSGSGNTLYVQACICLPQVPGSLIQAGTVTATQIAAGTITAGLLAAGIVVAGIVDTTNVFANTYVATNAGGEFLAYDVSSPTAGHLANSIAGAAGTDSVTNAFPAGIMSQQLTLVNQSSAPAAFTNSSQLYTSSSGRLRYLSDPGADMVLDRSSMLLTNNNMTNNTLPIAMSQAFSYKAGEAQSGSIYEIEIDGTIHSPTSGSAQALTMSLFIDGAAFANAPDVGLGGVMLQTSQIFAYSMRYRLTVTSTGAGGTCDIVGEGAVSRSGVNAGNIQSGGGMTASPLNIIASGAGGNAFDTTANHTLAIYFTWQGAGTGSSAQTIQTKLTRRN